MMKAAELVCVNCKNWSSKECHSCFNVGDISTYDKLVPPPNLYFTNYDHAFITPEEYEKRTEEKLDNSAKVWWKFKNFDYWADIPENWGDCQGTSSVNKDFVVVNGPYSPNKNWG
jgi:hypothetical protein